MCNSEITVAILEKAIVDEKKANKKKRNQRQRLGPQIIEQELPPQRHEDFPAEDSGRVELRATHARNMSIEDH